MNKKDRAMQQDECWQCFDESPYTTMSLIWKNKPYAVPLSCARIGKTVYFHCAKAGSKLEALQEQNNVWLSSVSHVENKDTVSTTFYRSCMMKGVCEIVNDEHEKLDALRAICTRYAKDYLFHNGACVTATDVYAVNIDEIYGKQNKNPI